MSATSHDQGIFESDTDWLGLLLEIMRGDRAASDIISIDGGELSSPAAAPRAMDGASTRLVERGAQVSPWIADDLRQDIASRALDAQPDAIFAILLPLLPELRSLGVQVDSELVQATVARIAKAYAAAPQASASEAPLPLGRLVVMHTYGDNGGHGGSIGLHGIAPFLSLPSMQRVILRSGRDSSFSKWPADLPGPRAPEVYFGESSVTKSAVASFIKAWEAPCVVRQSWSSGGHNWDIDLDWDHATVSGEVDPCTGLIKEGTRQETVELRYEDIEDMTLLGWGQVGTDDTFSEDLNALYDGQVYTWSKLI